MRRYAYKARTSGERLGSQKGGILRYCIGISKDSHISPAYNFVVFLSFNHVSLCHSLLSLLSLFSIPAADAAIRVLDSRLSFYFVHPSENPLSLSLNARSHSLPYIVTENTYIYTHIWDHCPLLQILAFS
ncbi:hypothetical protein GQ457_01G015710 [Hibiscus cannabinus]